MKRTIFVIGSTLLLAVIFTIPVLAGGWAVITLDALPASVTANQPLEIGFMIRQHGVTPLGGQSPVITAHLAGSIKSVKALAREEGKVGHYAAELTLPQTGEWNWSIAAFTVDQPMPALTVVETAMPVAKNEPAASNPLPLLAGGVGLFGAIGGLLALQRKARWAVVFVVVGLIISGAGFVSAANQPKAEGKPAAQIESATSISSRSQVDLGRDLFIAKGCMLCHSHTATNQLREFGVDIGPNLTSFTASPEYLRLWLKNPSALKPATPMPNLELSDAEIEALIAFINAK